MAATPMSYASLKILLQYVKPQKRFEIAHRCPSIRSAERAAPLHLESLHFSGGAVKVNNTTYKVEIRRRSAIGIVEFSASHEVDRFGVEDPSDLAALTPGDVFVNGEPQAREEERAPDEIIEQLQNRIQEYDQRIQGEIIFEQNPFILEDRRKLLALQYRRDNVDPPYEHFLQLTIDDRKPKRKQIHRFVYNKRFREAMKCIGEYLFRGRRLVINFKSFIVVEKKTVLRLPPGIMFRIEDIHFTGQSQPTFDSLMPILHESSFPLKQVTATTWDPSYVTHPLVREAHTFRSGVSPDLATFLAISNQIGELKSVSSIFTFDFLNAVIENWIQTRKRVGTDFTIQFSNAEGPEFLNRLEQVCNRFNGVITEEGVKISLCSRKADRTLKRCGQKQLSYFDIFDKFQLNSLEHLELSLLEAGRAEGGVCTSHRLFISVRFGVSVEVVVSVDDRNSYKFNVESLNKLDQIAGTRKILTIKDTFIPVVLLDDWNMCTFWNNRADGLMFLLNCLVKRFRHVEHEVYVHEKIKSDALGSLRKIIDYSSLPEVSLTEFWIYSGVQMPIEDFKYILQNVKFRDHLVKKCAFTSCFEVNENFELHSIILCSEISTYSSGHWITLQYLLNCEHKKIEIGGSKFTNEEIKTYMKQRVAGTIPDVQEIRVDMAEPFEVKHVLSGLQWCKSSKCSRHDKDWDSHYVFVKGVGDKVAKIDNHKKDWFVMKVFSDSEAVDIEEGDVETDVSEDIDEDEEEDEGDDEDEEEEGSDGDENMEEDGEEDDREINEA